LKTQQICYKNIKNFHRIIFIFFSRSFGIVLLNVLHNFSAQRKIPLKISANKFSLPHLISKKKKKRHPFGDGGAWGALRG
jgi:hypothetical protein